MFEGVKHEIEPKCTESGASAPATSSTATSRRDAMRPLHAASRVLCALLLALAGAACATRSQERASTVSSGSAMPAEVRAAVDAPDRSADDRALDAGRQPARTLAFFGIRPGARVAELGAGGGYTTELIARVVGPQGRVYAQNSPFMLERFAAAPWSARLAKPVMKNVVRLDRAFDDPFPSDLRNLDAVLIVLLYHDTVWMKVDRGRMNRAVFTALAPGGVYGIVDHSAKSGSGLADVESLHRIEEPNLRSEVEAAGFQLAAEGDFLRNPGDARDWSASPRAAGERRGTSDRFVLKFVKPKD
jgi:predicted methyltransferase